MIPKPDDPSQREPERELEHEAAPACRELEEFERLDRLVRILVEKFGVLRHEQAALRQQLEERDARIRSLDEQLLELNQTRRDAAKRIDDLIAQIDHLDARLGAQADASARAAGSE